MKQTKKNVKHQEKMIKFISSCVLKSNAIRLAFNERGQLSCPLSPREMAYTRFIKKKQAELDDMIDTTSHTITSDSIKQTEKLKTTLHNQLKLSDLDEINTIRGLSDTPKVFENYFIFTNGNKSASHGTTSHDENKAPKNQTPTFYLRAAQGF